MKSTAPRSLGNAGKKLWKSIQEEFRITDAPGLETLLQICLAADRAERCAEEIAQDGQVIRSESGGMRDHPLIKHELAARSFVVRSLHRLGFDIEAPRITAGRPPGTFRTGS
jgi:hypothetical protein